MKFLDHTSRPLSQGRLPSEGRLCRRLRGRHSSILSRHFGPDALWVRRHLAQCPRCRRRMMAWNKVELAFSVVKSQAHHLDLVRQANAGALKMLAHSLREAPQAQTLTDPKSDSEPSVLARSGNYRHWAMNLAACFVILLLTKSGVFSSLSHLNDRGEKAIRQYYVNHVGDDLAGELFDT